MRVGSRRGRATLGALAALAIASLFLVPVVPVSTSIAFLGGNFEPSVSACKSLASTASTAESPPLTTPDMEKCLESHLYPPAEIAGSSTVSFKVLGIGPAPYPSKALVTQGNESALVYFRGASIEAAEVYEAPITSLDPRGVVRVDNQSISFSPGDLLEFSATVTNTSPRPFARELVRVEGSGPFSGGNVTSGGVTWIGWSPAPCSGGLSPGSNCLASVQSLSFPHTNTTELRLTVEVYAELNGTWFLYQQPFVVKNPYTGQVNSEWVAAFMGAVDSARNGTALHESQALDSFAQARFESQVANYAIANYGLSSDYAKLLRASGIQVGEATLFPGRFLPGLYASVVSRTPPGIGRS